jgi:hypothetical protein
VEPVEVPEELETQPEVVVLAGLAPAAAAALEAALLVHIAATGAVSPSPEDPG